MGHFEEIIKLIRLMIEYLDSGKMRCEQIPLDDILLFISEEYTFFQLDAEAANEIYKKLFESCIERQDKEALSALLRNLVMENDILKKLYLERVENVQTDKVVIPYRVELLYYKNKQRNYRGCNQNSVNKEQMPFVGKGVVYSAITGGYDSFRDPVFVDKNLDYILFTDQEGVTSDVWRVVHLNMTDDLDVVRRARKLKILGPYEYLKDYDFSIWVDGKVQIIGDVLDYANRWSEGAPILCFNHYKSDDIYQEAMTCSMFDRDDPFVIEKQVNRYRMEGYPEHSGMIDSCFLLRDHHNDQLKRTMEDWWEEVKNGSKRDQLSFNYVCWKNNLLYDTFPLVSFEDHFLRTYEHA